MATIQSLGEIQSITTPWSTSITYSGVRMYDSFNYDYAALYKLQPNIRTCVDFLARNIAQLGLHIFRRVSDTDRERLNDHPLADLIGQPLPPAFKVTRYRLIESLISDLGIYFNAYWLKIYQDGRTAGLLRIPPPYMTVKGNLVISGYEMNLGGRLYEFEPEQIVHFRGYNSENAISGLSPLETLRRVLAEEHAAGKYREGFWQNAARMNGIVKRPVEAPEWSETARARFKAEFEQLYSGADNSGKTAVLEEGMEWEGVSFNAQESEYLAGRKLTREECARAYHIPLPMVGILDHATFSNIKEQHKQLYQDSLGPWLAMIEGDIDLQLLPDFSDSEGVYSEFNIAEKLQGDFEDQIQALQAAVGRPWMTANEARARLNLPSLGGDADLLVTPLNVLVGGQASPQDSAPQSRGLLGDGRKRFDPRSPALRDRHQEKWRDALARHYRRQEAAVLSRMPKGRKLDIGGIWWDEERWNVELSTDLFRLNNLTAMAFAERLLEQVEPDDVDMEAFEANMLPWLEEHSRIQAESFNEQTREALAAALREPEQRDAVVDLFAAAATTWAWRQAVGSVTSASSFGSMEAARAGKLRTKTWHVNSSNPRDSHSAQDGMTINIRDTFPNGLRWPGDPRGSADENAMCQCTISFDV
jgi:HK97 family phage portal protein